MTYEELHKMITKEEAKKKFPIGSKAKAINSQGTHNFVEGDIVTVVGYCVGPTEGSGKLLYVDFDGVRFTSSPSRFEPVVEPVEEPKEESGNKYFFIGDSDVVSFSTKDKLLTFLDDYVLGEFDRIIYGKEMSIVKTVDVVEKE
jgi:hypothetical protein